MTFDMFCKYFECLVCQIVFTSWLTSCKLQVFNCPIRGDSATVLSELKGSSHDLVSGVRLNTFLVTSKRFELSMSNAFFLFDI